MSKKRLGMNRAITQFNKACQEMGEYIEAFNYLPPRGDGAKAMAIQEWKECINDVVIQLNNIKNLQIQLIEKGNYENIKI